MAVIRQDEEGRAGWLRSPTAKRLIRAYGPVLVIALLFVLLALLVPTVDRPVP